MKNTISQTRVKTKISQAYNDMLKQHAQRIAQLKGNSQQQPPVRKRVPLEYSWATVSHPDYTLLVYPQDDIEFTSWVLPFEQQPPFTSGLEVAIAYLHVPFIHGTDAELTLNDNVYWITESQVMAAAKIESILYQDIVLTEQGIIVPAMVVPFHRFQPCGFDSLYAYVKEADDDATVNKVKNAVAAALNIVSIPKQLAHPIVSQLSWSLLNYIDEHYYRSPDEAVQAEDLTE